MTDAIISATWTLLASAAQPLTLSFKPCYSQEPWLGRFIPYLWSGILLAWY